VLPVEVVVRDVFPPSFLFPSGLTRELAPEPPTKPSALEAPTRLWAPLGFWAKQITGSRMSNRAIVFKEFLLFFMILRWLPTDFKL
jgi:hypothetical protein